MRTSSHYVQKGIRNQFRRDALSPHFRLPTPPTRLVMAHPEHHDLPASPAEIERERLAKDARRKKRERKEQSSPQRAKRLRKGRDRAKVRREEEKKAETPADTALRRRSQATAMRESRKRARAREGPSARGRDAGITEVRDVRLAARVVCVKEKGQVGQETGRATTRRADELVEVAVRAREVERGVREDGERNRVRRRDNAGGGKLTRAAAGCAGDKVCVSESAGLIAYHLEWTVDDLVSHCKWVILQEVWNGDESWTQIVAHVSKVVRKVEKLSAYKWSTTESSRSGFISGTKRQLEVTMDFSGRSEGDPTAGADVKGTTARWVNLFSSHLAKIPSNVRGLSPHEFDDMFPEARSTLELDSYRCAPPVAAGDPFGPPAAAGCKSAAEAPDALVHVHLSSIGSGGTWGSLGKWRPRRYDRTLGDTFDTFMRGKQAERSVENLQTNCRRSNRSAFKFQLRWFNTLAWIKYSVALAGATYTM